MRGILAAPPQTTDGRTTQTAGRHDRRSCTAKPAHLLLPSTSCNAKPKRPHARARSSSPTRRLPRVRGWLCMPAGVTDRDDMQKAEGANSLLVGEDDPLFLRIKDPARYKSQMCQNFMARGKCPYYEKCQFAHGTEEMRAAEELRSRRGRDGR